MCMLKQMKPCWEMIPLPRHAFYIEKAKTMAAFPPDSFQPIVLREDGCCADGQHRCAAAILRGDSTIWAWVP